jgi:o-succinylbenzoate synthase
VGELTVTAVDTREFAVDLVTPLGTADGEIDRREGLLVRVTAETADGEAVTGVGEATPLPGWTEPLSDCREAVREMATDLRGVRATAAPVVSALYDGAPAASHGVGLAVGDLLARHFETVPLWRYLFREAATGPDAADQGRSDAASLRANATVGDADTETTTERAREAVARGFDCLKLKVGARSVETDLDRLVAVRRAVDDEVTLRADANAAWDRSTARRFLDGLAERGVDLAYLEQPVAAEDVGGLAALREREQRRSLGRRTGIAADESVVAAGHEAVIEAGAADAVVLKPMALGGPLATVDAASDAGLAGTRPVVTTTVDAVVARTAAVHVAAAVEQTGRVRGTAHGLATGSMLSEDLGTDPAPVADGQIRVPDGLGTGVEGVFER